VELLLADSGVDAGARAIGADADGGFAWSGRRRWCRRRSSAASYGVIGNDRKFRSTDSGNLRRALSPTFRAGEMVFFIPWRVVAEDSGAAHLDLLGPPGWCGGCWPHDGDVTGGAGFLFSDIPVRGRRWSSGDRSDRRCGRCGATGSTPPTALIESRVDRICGVLSLRHFGLARWCSLSLGGWSPKILARRSKQ
jgi:hypothetical protein